MSVKLADKLAETKTMTLRWGDDDVDVSYYVNAVTPELLERVDAAAAQDDMSVLGVVLEPILEWWDVLDGKGKRLPTTAAQIAKMPMRWINLVQDGLQVDQNPPEGATSGAG
jgi:hypothetical protein